MRAALTVDVVRPEADLLTLKRSEVLIITSWYPTPDAPFSYSFISDHLTAWTRYLFEDDGVPLAVIHPQEALSVFSAIKHRQSPFRGSTAENGWRVVHTQPWRVKRRWSDGDLAREAQALRSALTHFRWFDKRAPRIIVAQTLSAARQGLHLRDSMGWSSPVVLVEHSGPLAMQFQVPATEPYQRRALRAVDAVIAVSQNLADSIAEVRGRENLDVIANPVDARAFSVPLPSKWTSGRLRLVNVGFCTEQKAQHVLIESVAVLTRRGLDVELEVVGDGPERGRLERLAAEAGLGDRVMFRGAQPRTEVLDALSRAHLFVFPSRWENCPVALQEAQAVGLPVVVSRNGASEIILVHEDNRVCPVDDPPALAAAIESLASSPHRQTAQQRREIARLAFAPEYFASKCRRVFSGVIATAENEESSSIRTSV